MYSRRLVRERNPKEILEAVETHTQVPESTVRALMRRRDVRR